MTAKEEQLIRAQQALIENNPIQISGRIKKELFPKVNPMIFRDILQREILFSDYGDGISKFYFTFIAMEITPNFSDWIGIDYYPKTRKVDIGVEIPSKEVPNANQTETIHLMEKAFLEGIDLIATKKLAAPFDHQAFKKDVEAIFAQENWYEEDLKKYRAMPSLGY